MLPRVVVRRGTFLLFQQESTLACLTFMGRGNACPALEKFKRHHSQDTAVAAILDHHKPMFVSERIKQAMGVSAAFLQMNYNTTIIVENTLDLFLRKTTALANPLLGVV